MTLGRVIDVLVLETLILLVLRVCLLSQHFLSYSVIAAACMNIWGHNPTFYQVSVPFVNSCINQDFSRILQDEVHMLTRCV